MKADAKETADNANAKREARAVANAGDSEPLADPFASDLFAAYRLPLDDSLSGPPESQTAALSSSHAASDATPWHARLPRISQQEARLSSALAAVSPALYERAMKACAQVLAGYCHVSTEDVAISVVSLREGELAHLTGLKETAPCLHASLAVEPEGARLLVETDAAFCAMLIDLLLGGKGAAPDSLRPLSLVEQSVMEFLWLNLLRELNAELGEPLFRLDGLTAEPPAWLRTEAPFDVASAPQDTPASLKRGLIATVRIAVARTTGLARCAMTFDALALLSASQNPLLARERARALPEKLAQLKRLVPEVTLHLLVGETEVDAFELAGLECGDVLLVERSSVSWQDGRIAGRLRLRAGDGQGALIAGTTAEDAHHPSRSLLEVAEGKRDAAPLNLLVETIYTGETNAALEQLKMEEEERGEETSAEGVALLEGLTLTVHVELAARRIGLEELSRLRVGQVLELDCSATDPVELVADGRRIARGELVEIEGRLGVRVTQIAK